VTVDAERACACAEHLIARLGDRMITVAGYAFAKPFLIKSSFVGAGLEQFSLTPMTLAADIRHRSDARRCRAMIAMTIVTGWRRQILFFIKSLRMNALLILVVLIARYFESPHVISAGMTLGARFGNVRRINRRERIGDGSDAMYAVTTDAGGYARLSGFEQLAVHARVVLLFLIYSQRRIEFLHQVRVAVALAAVCGNVERLWFSQIALSWILSGFFGICVGIAAMAIIARKSPSMMNVVIEKFRRRAQSGIFQFRVAFDARTLFLRGGQRKQQENERRPQRGGGRPPHNYGCGSINIRLPMDTHGFHVT